METGLGLWLGVQAWIGCISPYVRGWANQSLLWAHSEAKGPTPMVGTGRIKTETLFSCLSYADGPTEKEMELGHDGKRPYRAGLSRRRQWTKTANAPQTTSALNSPTHNRRRPPPLNHREMLMHDPAATRRNENKNRFKQPSCHDARRRNKPTRRKEDLPTMTAENPPANLSRSSGACSSFHRFFDLAPSLFCYDFVFSWFLWMSRFSMKGWNFYG